MSIYIILKLISRIYTFIRHFVRYFILLMPIIVVFARVPTDHPENLKFKKKTSTHIIDIFTRHSAPHLIASGTVCEFSFRAEFFKETKTVA